MFEIAKTYHWWAQAQKYPFLSYKPNVLKPVGYAHLIDHIDRFNCHRVLEIGHGDGSMLFPIKNDTCEMWGIEDVATAKWGDIEKFRGQYGHRAKFTDGLFGVNSEALPSGYFDMIGSVSVVEHVPETALAAFMAESMRVLRPGGLMVHSYDVWLRQPTKLMFDAIIDAGFTWLRPDCLSVFWEDWLPAPDGLSAEGVKHQPVWGEQWPEGRKAPLDFALLHQVIVENPFFVAEYYMVGMPREYRPAPQTYMTVLIAAQKPEA